MGSWKKPKACSLSRPFPPDQDVSWVKSNHRLERQRLKRVSVSPEESGLCGCWQFVAIRREREELGRKAKPASDEIGYYATSVSTKEFTDEELIGIIRGHWDACENGAHYRRDVSFGEDACAVSKRGAAQVLSALRNFVLGDYELAMDGKKTKARGVKSRSRQMTFTMAFKALKR